MSRSIGVTKVCRARRLTAVTCRVAIVLTAIAASDALAQQGSAPRSGQPPTRPTGPGARGNAGQQGGRMFQRPAINGNGMTGADLNSFIYRPNSMLSQQSFMAPVRRMSLAGTVASLKNAPTQADYQETLEEIKNADRNRELYSDVLAKEIISTRRQTMSEAWEQFRQGDYLRAREGFTSAGVVDSRSPAPHFGELIVDVQKRNYRRAMMTLTRIIEDDFRRPPGVDGMFEHNISLRRAYGVEDDLLTAMYHLRELAQLNPDNPPVQTLYAYILWYSRYDDLMVEAMSVMARLQRTVGDPNSVWSKLLPLMQEAQRKMRQAALDAAASPPVAAPDAAAPTEVVPKPPGG